MTRTALLVSTIALAEAFGCGGRESGTGPAVGGDSSGSAGSGTTETGSSGAIGPVPCNAVFADAATTSAGEAGVPLNHRAAGACCPSQRGPGPSGQPYPPGSSCLSDSQCVGGVNGRCSPDEGLVGLGGCSYDECFTNSDCPSGTPCVCRSSASDNGANTCAPAGGNCVVDSDCGPDSYCSPSPPSSCYERTLYYCHTAADTCINDADCAFADGGGFPSASSPSVSATCTYDIQAQKWGCGQESCFPP